MAKPCLNIPLFVIIPKLLQPNIGILPNKFAAALDGILKTKDANQIAANIKSKEFVVTGTRGWNEADFTAGGIDVEEVRAETLESKLHKRLYFAGEVIEGAASSGGYNLQQAFSTGYLAGESAGNA